MNSMIKFIYSEKASISTLLLNGTTLEKSKVEILQNFVAFSEYQNFKNARIKQSIDTWQMKRMSSFFLHSNFSLKIKRKQNWVKIGNRLFFVCLLSRLVCAAFRKHFTFLWHAFTTELKGKCVKNKEFLHQHSNEQKSKLLCETKFLDFLTRL